MSIDLTTISTPFGLLDAATKEALMAHDGTIQRYYADGWERSLSPIFINDYTYRVKPGPQLTKNVLDVFIDGGGFIQPSHISSLTKRVRVTFDRIDGVIDLPSYRVVPR